MNKKGEFLAETKKRESEVDRVSRSRSESSCSDKSCIEEKEETKTPETCPSTSKTKDAVQEMRAHQDVLTESELLVKIADLGNACWIVSPKFGFKLESLI